MSFRVVEGYLFLLALEQIPATDSSHLHPSIINLVLSTPRDLKLDFFQQKRRSRSSSSDTYLYTFVIAFCSVMFKEY